MASFLACPAPRPMAVDGHQWHCQQECLHRAPQHGVSGRGASHMVAPRANVSVSQAKRPGLYDLALESQCITSATLH